MQSSLKLWSTDVLLSDADNGSDRSFLKNECPMSVVMTANSLKLYAIPQFGLNQHNKFYGHVIPKRF